MAIRLSDKSRRVVVSLSVIILFLTVIITLSLYGKSSRIYTSGTAAIFVDSPEKAYSIWAEKKVKGRVLLLFDEYPLIKKSSDYTDARQLGPTNFIEFAVFDNIVRRIYCIVPNDRWESFIRQAYLRFSGMEKGLYLLDLHIPIILRKASGMERGLYLYNLVGISLIATTPSSLPDLSETTLVYINSRMFDETDVKEILSEKGIASDIIISYKGAM